MAAAAIFLYGCAGVGEHKHQALELVCSLCSECVHVLLVRKSVHLFSVCCLFVFSPFCCFASLPTVSSNLLQLPLFPKVTTHHWLLYLQLMCMWNSSQTGKHRTLWLNLRLRFICAPYVIMCVCEYLCMWSFTSVTLEGYKGILCVPALIAGSGQQKPRNPTVITRQLIDSAGTERGRWRPRDRQGERGEKVDLCYCVLHWVYRLPFRRGK